MMVAQGKKQKTNNSPNVKSEETEETTFSLLIYIINQMKRRHSFMINDH